MSKSTHYAVAYDTPNGPKRVYCTTSAEAFDLARELCQPGGGATAATVIMVEETTTVLSRFTQKDPSVPCNHDWSYDREEYSTARTCRKCGHIEVGSNPAGLR